MAIRYLKANSNYAACAWDLALMQLKDYTLTGKVDDLPRSGRPLAKNERFTSTLYFIIIKWYSTIENYAIKEGLKFKHFIEKPKLTEFHKTLIKMMI